MRAVKVFVDTSAWIAAAVASDTHHDEALRQFNRLLAQDALCVTSNYVVAETVTWLRYRVGHPAAVEMRNVLEESLQAQRLVVEWVTERVEQSAWRLFVKYADHKLSLTDCTSVVLAQELDLDVFAFDPHFAVLGLNVLTES